MDQSANNKRMSLFNKLQQNIWSVKNLSLYFLASLFSALIGLLFNPFLAKNLSSLDYSIIGYYTSFNSLFTPLLNFSLISYYVRKYFQIQEDKRQLVCDTIICVLLVWGCISTLLILGGFYLFHQATHVEFPFFPFALMTIAQLFFQNFLTLYQVNNRMQRNAKRYFRIVVTSTLLTLVLSVLLVIVFKFGAIGRLSALLLSSIVIAIYCIKHTLGTFRFDESIIKEAVSFGWPVSCGYIIQYFLLGVDMALIAPIGNVDMMGLYVVGSSLALHLSIFGTALNQTFEPDIYQSVARHNYKKIIKIYFLIFVVLLSIILLFVICAKPITAILTFNKYTAAFPFARIVSFSVLTTFLMTSIECVINAFGFTKTCLVCKIIGAVLALLFYIVLINAYEYNGAAIARVLAPFLVFIAGIVGLFFIYPKIKSMRMVC